ncbi:MAG: hypothetical protein ACXWBP_11885 [Limisphaerales bacterium]
MKLTLTRCTGWRTVSHFVVLFCLLLTIPWSRSAVVVSTETKLTASDNRTNLLFGTSVAIDSGLAAVGAPDTTNGAVYTYALVGGNWVQTQKLTDPAPPCGGDKFGTSVAMQDGLLVVGQPEGCSSLGLTGRAFVYRLIGGTWVLQQTLTEIPPLPQFPSFGFGSAVSISGNTIAVSDPENSAGVAVGAISIFTNNGTTWNPQAQIFAPFGNENVNSFGSAITVDGDTLLVGAPLLGAFGAAYVYVRTGTIWTLQQTLTPPVLRSAELFGTAVALEGDTAVVGAPGMTIPPLGGATFVFHRSGTTWTSTQELEATDGVTNNALGFGSSISLLNGTMVIGAPGRTVNGQANAGGADIFQFNGTSWVLAQQIAAFDPTSAAAFGSAVDIGESGVIVGAPFDITGFLNAGAAYIFSPSETQPVIVSASASPNRLFPPNHKLVPVTISVTTQGNVASCKITSVTSNQPINGKGDGNTSPDWIVTGDLTVLLRAERAGNIKTDRVYTITVQCTDSFGNSAITRVRVTVPHDNGK